MKFIFIEGAKKLWAFPKKSGFRKYNYVTSILSMLNIVVSLADSICRHPDVTLESGLLRHTYEELYPHDT